MDGTILNIRILSWHFQIARDTYRLSVSRNDYHREKGWPDGYCSIYRIGSYTK